MKKTIYMHTFYISLGDMLMAKVCIIGTGN